ncbi:RNA polymerase sigma factor [Actinomadura welshii]
MRGDMGSLYDAHADRLYAHCWSLVGDQLAAAAVGDAFTAAVHRPPRGDTVLWLYSLSRSACAERGAFSGNLDGRGGVLFAGSDPLLRAAGALRSDHREVLLLWAGEWLEPHDIARVLGIAPDTVLQLLEAARTRLERSVLDLLMRGTTEAQHDLITAFEKKRLPRLLARRAPARAPGWLRDRVLEACADEAVRPLPTVTAPSPLVVIGADRPRHGHRDGERARRGLSGGVHKGLGAAAGVAASAAAVIGLLATWPSAKDGAGAATITPTASNGQANPASSTGSPRHPMPNLSGTEDASGEVPGTPDDPAATGGDSGPAGRPGQAPAGGPGGGPAQAPPAASPSGTPSQERGPSSPSAPSQPDDPTTPPPGGESPTAPPDAPDDPTTPPDDGSGDPATPPPDTPSDPPSGDPDPDPGTGDPGTPSPSPTSNPTPSPSGD